jgi:hypothetical protein
MGTLRQHLCTVMTIPRLIVSDKVVEKSNIHFIWNNYVPKSFCLLDNVEIYCKA